MVLLDTDFLLQVFWRRYYKWGYCFDVFHNEEIKKAILVPGMYYNYQAD